MAVRGCPIYLGVPVPKTVPEAKPTFHKSALSGCVKSYEEDPEGSTVLVPVLCLVTI